MLRNNLHNWLPFVGLATGAIVPKKPPRAIIMERVLITIASGLISAVLALVGNYYFLKLDLVITDYKIAEYIKFDNARFDERAKLRDEQAGEVKRRMDAIDLKLEEILREQRRK